MYGYQKGRFGYSYNLLTPVRGKWGAKCVKRRTLVCGKRN